MSLPTKPSLSKLKARVEAQESKLKEGMKVLNAARKGQSKGASPSAGSQQTDQTTGWNHLERVIGQMDDLLISYKEYSSELERRLRDLERKVTPPKKLKR